MENTVPTNPLFFLIFWLSSKAKRNFAKANATICLFIAYYWEAMRFLFLVFFFSIHLQRSQTSASHANKLKSWKSGWKNHILIRFCHLRQVPSKKEQYSCLCSKGQASFNKIPPAVGICLLLQNVRIVFRNRKIRKKKIANQVTK